MTDLTKYKGVKFLDEAGTFESEITGCETEYNPNKGCDQIKYSFETASGVITKLYFLNDNAGIFLKLLAEMCGLTQNELEHFDANMLVGKHVLIEVAPYTANNGNEYMQIKAVHKSVTPYEADKPF